MNTQETAKHEAGDRLHFTPSADRAPHGTVIGEGDVIVTAVVDHGSATLHSPRFTYVVQSLHGGMTQGTDDRELTPCATQARIDAVAAEVAAEPGPIVRDAECPHGCGALHWVDDMYICPACGDEWAEETMSALTDEGVAEPEALAEAEPVAPSIELALTPSIPTREGWLLAAVAELAPLFAEIGRTVPAVRVSCGWPATAGTRRKARRIGECWASMCSGDGTREIFISPVLAEPVAVLETLAHELCHAADTKNSGHTGDFAKMARGIGLEGKLTATNAGAALRETLAAVAERLGRYPHAALTPGQGGGKKQTTRMIKCQCGECGYVARTTRQWLDSYGAPICPCNQEPMSF